MTVLDLNLSTGSSFSTCAILEIGPVFDVVDTEVWPFRRLSEQDEGRIWESGFSL